MKIYTCKRGISSAKKLGEAFNKPVVVLNRHQMPDSKDDVFINWGCSWIGGYYPKILNYASEIDFMRNKIAVLEHLRNLGAHTIPFTTQKMVAEEWDDIVIRHLVKSNNSKGVERQNIADKPLPDAKLYTKFIQGNEYRAYVVNGSISSIYWKVPLQEFPCSKWKFKILKDDDIKFKVQAMIHPFKTLWGFYAVDFISNDDGQFILEVNSTPILFPSVIEDIKRAYDNPSVHL